jgi:hypothetical protein
MTVFPYPELDAEKEAQYELFPINLTRMMLHTPRVRRCLISSTR